MVHELESTVNTPSARHFENIGRGVLSAIKAIGAAVLLSYALKSAPACAQDDGFATGRQGTGSTHAPSSMAEHEASQRKAAEDKKYSDMAGNVYSRIHSYMVEKGDSSTAATLQSAFSKFKASNNDPKIQYQWLTDWMSSGSYTPEELAYFLCRVNQKPPVAAAGKASSGQADAADATPKSKRMKRARAPRAPAADKPYSAEGVSSEVGMQMGDIESTIWGLGISVFDDTNGDELFRLFYRKSQDGKIYLDEENPSEYGRQLFGLRINGASGGSAKGFGLDIGGDIEDVAGSFSAAADPITSGPLTIDQATDESFEDSYSRLWLNLRFPAADGRINFGIAGRNYKQTSDQTDTVRTSGDIQSSDPNFPDPIHVDRTEVVQTESETADNATIYEIMFNSGKGDVPFKIGVRWMEGKQSSDITQTVNGAPQVPQNTQNEYGQVMVTFEAADQEGTSGGTYLLGIVDGDGIQDRDKVLLALGQAWLSENGSMALGLDAEYNSGVSAGITLAARRQTYGSMEMESFLDLMRAGRDGRLPMDMMSEEGRRAFNEHLWPVALKEGVGIEARKYWGTEGERGGEERPDGWSGKLAACYQGVVFQLSHIEDGISKSDAVTLGKYGEKLTWYAGFQSEERPVEGSGDDISSSSIVGGVKVDF